MSDPVAPRNTTMAVAASALRAQQARMRVIAENIANAESTAPVEGGDPYRRRVPVFETRAIDGESMDMREAQRAYEANLNVIETARAMDQRILELLRK